MHQTHTLYRLLYTIHCRGPVCRAVMAAFMTAILSALTLLNRD